MQDSPSQLNNMKKITRNLELESRALQMIKGSEKEMQRLGIELLKAYLNSYKKFKLFRNDHLHKKCGVDAKIQKEFDEAVKAYVGPYCTFHIDIDDPSVRHIVTLPATMPSEWKLDILYKEYINLRNNANGRIHKEMPIQRRFY
jgi:hypothetical protein